MTQAFRWLSLLLLMGWSVGACRPVPGFGDSCAEAPCAAGLRCVEDRCTSVSSSGPVSATCLSEEDCAVEGSSDGRACLNGACVWRECTGDLACGGRICDQGFCRERELCADVGDCGGGEVCDDGVCRTACVVDEECGAFSACAAGVCVSRCLADWMCFGDVCEDGLCVAPECGGDEDCPVDGNYLCQSGRCVSFLPCQEDVDCFDPDYLCNEAGRCEERPLCQVDADCGVTAICRSAHCQPATPCDVDEMCAANEECLAGRCVSRPGCRTASACDAGEVCVNQMCTEMIMGAAEHIVIGSGLGDCERDGTGKCALVLFPGETTLLQVAGYTASGEPLIDDWTYELDDPEVAMLETTGVGRVAVWASNPGTTRLRVVAGSGATHESMSVVVVPQMPGEVGVLVVDGDTGAGIEDAVVRWDDLTVNTDPSGVARIPLSEALPPSVRLFVQYAGQGQAYVEVAPSPAMRIVLESPPTLPGNAAGIVGGVVSSGDETGAVGVGLVIPGHAAVEDANLLASLGAPFVGSLEIPVLGLVRVPLPAGATLEASLPLLGTQTIRDQAYVSTSAGRRSALAYEGRFEQARLFSLIGGTESTDLALNLVTDAEGMDVTRADLGELAAYPTVTDGDLSDGTADVDGDGDIDELVPDYAAFSEFVFTPTRPPRERVGLQAARLPPNARARAFVTAGVELPGAGFLPLGVGTLTVGEAARAGQLKIQPPDSGAISLGDRALMLDAVFDDVNLRASLLYRGDDLGPRLELGAFLSPPDAPPILTGVPTPDESLMILPGIEDGDAYRVRLRSLGQAWTLWVKGAPGGQSVVVPNEMASMQLESIEAFRLDDDASDHALAETLSSGAGPIRFMRHVRAVGRRRVP